MDSGGVEAVRGAAKPEGEGAEMVCGTREAEGGAKEVDGEGREVDRQAVEAERREQRAERQSRSQNPGPPASRRRAFPRQHAGKMPALPGMAASPARG